LVVAGALDKEIKLFVQDITILLISGKLLVYGLLAELIMFENANKGALYINCKSPLYKVIKLFFISASVTIVLPLFGEALNVPGV
jgi:hypothetical protein